MRTHLAFRSRRFIEPDGQGNRFNPDIRGGLLAAFLSDEFRARGYAGTVIEEDWGWMVELASTPFDLWLGCASSDGQGDDAWLVFIEPSKPVIRRMFRKIDTQAEVGRIADLLESLILGPGEATVIDWQV